MSILGRVYIQVNGQHAGAFEASLEPGGEEYEYKSSDRGPEGPVCTGVKHSVLKFKIHTRKEKIGPEDVRQWIEVPAVFEGDNGLTYNIARCTRTKVPEVKREEMEVELQGTPAVKT